MVKNLGDKKSMKSRKYYKLKCRCGRGVVLKLIGGQYQYSYQGECKCGREWLLEDLTEDLAEDVIKVESGSEKFE